MAESFEFGEDSSPEILRDTSMCHIVVDLGSPGHTPFPQKRRKQDVADSSIDFTSPDPISDFSASADMSSFASPPPVPFNSPIDEERAAEEAKELEMQIKKKFKDNTAMFDVFKTPERVPEASKSKSRKRLLHPDVSGLEIMSKEERISDFLDNIPLREKELARNEKLKSALDMLKKIVPGLEDTTDKTEIFERTAKYVLFLKNKVTPEDDKAFLAEFLPF